MASACSGLTQKVKRVVYCQPVSGHRSPGIMHRQSAINNKLASKPAPKPTPKPNPKPKRIVPTKEENRSPDY